MYHTMYQLLLTKNGKRPTFVVGTDEELARILLTPGVEVVSGYGLDFVSIPTNGSTH